MSHQKVSLVALTKPMVKNPDTGEDLNMTAEEFISYCARVSNPLNQLNTETADKLIAYCIKNKHWSIFEQVNCTFEIETSRAIAAQILRHRTMKFQEFSQRYQELSEDDVQFYEARSQDLKNRQNSIDDLSDSTKEEWENIQKDCWETCFFYYRKALDLGIAKECARFLLPLSTKTRLYATADVRTLIHYIDLRTGNGTQKEHKDIAQKMKNLFIKEFPMTSKALEWI